MVQLVKVMLVACICVSMIGCPRIARVDIYNNTGVNVTVNMGGSVTQIPPNSNKELPFASETMIAKSKYGEWTYSRKLIPYGGERGAYYDGVVYLQLNASGQIFAVRKHDMRPVEKISEQPEGFPLEPGS